MRRSLFFIHCPISSNTGCHRDGLWVFFHYGVGGFSRIPLFVLYPCDRECYRPRVLLAVYVGVWGLFASPRHPRCARCVRHEGVNSLVMFGLLFCVLKFSVLSSGHPFVSFLFCLCPGVTALTPMFHIQSTSQSTFTLTVQGFGFSQSNLIWAVPHEHACAPPPVNCSVGLCLSSPTSSTTPTSLQSIARPLTIGLYTVCISFSGQAANAQPVPGDAFSVTGVTALSPVVLPPEENGVTMSVQGLGLLSSNGGSARFLAPTDSCSSGSTSQLVVSNFAGNSTDMTFKVATTSAARYLVCVLVSSSPSNSYSSAGVITVQGDDDYRS